MYLLDNIVQLFVSYSYQCWAFQALGIRTRAFFFFLVPYNHWAGMTPFPIDRANKLNPSVEESILTLNLLLILGGNY
jgi:hypothetical protein